MRELTNNELETVVGGMEVVGPLLLEVIVSLLLSWLRKPSP